MVHNRHSIIFITGINDVRQYILIINISINSNYSPFCFQSSDLPNEPLKSTFKRGQYSDGHRGGVWEAGRKE